jgi:hypothetical protein
MASTYLTRTFGSTGNRKTFTISVWVKRSSTGENNYIFDCPTSSNHDNSFRISNVDKFGFGLWNGSDVTQVVSNAKLRDCNGFYHLVASVDTTQATASDRVKLYINGELQTNLSSSSYPSQNYDYYINQNIAHYIGYKQPDNARYFKGVMSHFHFIDGTAYDASYFGSTDSTTGEWKINTSPSVTYGTNGFFILKDGNSVTDQSPNTNNFTVGGGTLTKTEDNPSNVFCTFNPLIGQGNQQNLTYSLGNTKVYSSSTGQESFTQGTLAFSSGKYYWEWMADGSDPEGNFWGVMDIDTYMGNGNINTGGNDNIWGSNQGSKFNGSNGGTYGTNVAVGEYGMVACDMDNGKLWFGKNGTWFSSGGYAGNPASGTYAGFTNLAGHTLTPFHSDNYSTKQPTGTYNFGNGYFGTTAVSSAGTNASNNGIFEYDVPTGFTALSTKGLNL